LSAGKAVQADYVLFVLGAISTFRETWWHAA